MVWPLPCRKINGVGPKADEKLQSHGIRTIGELAARELAWLMQTFGKSYGAWLHEAAWGRDDRPVETESEPVSMSRETTFERDLHAVRDRAEAGAVLTRLCEQVAADLQRQGYLGKTIGIKITFDNFEKVTRDQTIALHTADATVIRRHAGLCLKRVDLSRRFRLLGVKVGKLVKRGTEEATAAGYSEASSFRPTKDKHDELTDLLFPELD
jgi:DNA polymerase-4